MATKHPVNCWPTDDKDKWAKRTIFAALILLGMAFWIPSLLRATVWESDLSVDANPTTNPVPETAPTAEAAAGLKPTVITLSVLPETPFQTASAQNDSAASRSETVGLSTAFFQASADASPSRVGRISFSELPTKDVNKNLAATGDNHFSAPAKDAGLILSTTIIGKTRRAAVINGRLCREGDRLFAGGDSWRLASVAEDHVELVGDARADQHGPLQTLRLALQREVIQR